MTTKIPPYKLPDVEDSNWGYLFGSGKELARIRGYVEQKRPVWWALWGFHGRFAGIEPKWHVFAGRVQNPDLFDEFTFIWKAMCGYENARSALGDGEPRANVQAPKKDQRCKRCDKVLKDILEAGRANGLRGATTLPSCRP